MGADKLEDTKQRSKMGRDIKKENNSEKQSRVRNVTNVKKTLI